MTTKILCLSSQMLLYQMDRFSVYLTGMYPAWTYVTYSGETGNKSSGRCFSFSVLYCVGLTHACNQTEYYYSSITKHTEYSCGVCSWVTPFVIISSSKVSLSYWKGVPQLLDRNVLIVSDKDSLHCWFLVMRNLLLWLASCFTHRIRYGESGLSIIPPCIMAPAAMEQKLGRLGSLPNTARKLTE